MSGGRGRWAVLSGFACFGGFWGAWGALLPLVERHAGVSTSVLGVALLMVGLGALVSMRLAGGLLDRHGDVVRVAALVVFAVVGVAATLAHGAVGLVGVLFVLGASSGAVDACINATAVEHEQRTGSMVLGACHAVFSASVVVASAVVAVARSVVETPWVLMGVVAAVMLLMALGSARGGDTVNGEPVGEAVGREADDAAVSGGGRIPGRLWVLGGLGALAYLVENAWQSWGAILLQDDRHAPATVASLTATVFAVSALAGRGLLARSRLGRSMGLLGGAAGVAALASAGAALAPSAWLSLAGIAVAGLATSVCAPIIVSMAGTVPTGLSRGRVVSSVTTIAYAGFLVGPGMVGVVAGHAGLPTAMCVVAATAALLAVGCWATRYTHPTT